MNTKTVKINNQSNIDIKISLTPTNIANMPKTNYVSIKSMQTIEYAILSDNMNLFIINEYEKLLWHGVIPTIGEIIYHGNKCTVNGHVIPEGFLPITSLVLNVETSQTRNYLWWILLPILIITLFGAWFMTK